MGSEPSEFNHLFKSSDQNIYHGLNSLTKVKDIELSKYYKVSTLKLIVPRFKLAG